MVIVKGSIEEAINSQFWSTLWRMPVGSNRNGGGRSCTPDKTGSRQSIFI